jgi:lipoprotein signal peptidase
MPGLTNLTNVSMTKINYMTNVTDFPEFLIKINHTIYEGWLYFVLLIVGAIILFIIANKVYPDRILNNALFSFASITILAFFLRLITINEGGIVYGLLSDKQMWIFPLLTLIFAVIIWATKRST